MSSVETKATKPDEAANVPQDITEAIVLLGTLQSLLEQKLANAPFEIIDVTKNEKTNMYQLVMTMKPIQGMTDTSNYEPSERGNFARIDYAAILENHEDLVVATGKKELIGDYFAFDIPAETSALMTELSDREVSVPPNRKVTRMDQVVTPEATQHLQEYFAKEHVSKKIEILSQYISGMCSLYDSKKELGYNTGYFFDDKSLLSILIQAVDTLHEANVSAIAAGKYEDVRLQVENDGRELVKKLERKHINNVGNSNNKQ